MEVVLLGHYGLPDQTPPSAARDQFENDARQELNGLTNLLEDAEVSATTRLVFGKARDKTVNRVALEEECDVILTSGNADEVKQVLVPVRGKKNFDRILSFAEELLTATGAAVTLFHTGDESDRRSGEEILSDATDRLMNAGVDPDKISQQLSEEADTSQSIVDISESFDVLILGETEPSLRDRILGNVPAQVTADTDDPAFVVRSAKSD
jgi:nucleotide-binding universal stress UspA family protein